jgi:hypothetical protein
MHKLRNRAGARCQYDAQAQICWALSWGRVAQAQSDAAYPSFERGKGTRPEGGGSLHDKQETRFKIAHLRASLSWASSISLPLLASGDFTPVSSRADLLPQASHFPPCQGASISRPPVGCRDKWTSATLHYSDKHKKITKQYQTKYHSPPSSSLLAPFSPGRGALISKSIANCFFDSTPRLFCLLSSLDFSWFGLYFRGKRLQDLVFDIWFLSSLYSKETERWFSYSFWFYSLRR